MAWLFRPATAVAVADPIRAALDRDAHQGVMRVAAADVVAAELAGVFERFRLDLAGAAEENLALALASFAK